MVEVSHKVFDIVVSISITIDSVHLVVGLLLAGQSDILKRIFPFFIYFKTVSRGVARIFPEVPTIFQIPPPQLKSSFFFFHQPYHHYGEVMFSAKAFLLDMK